MASYVPSTKAQREEMLSVVGKASGNPALDFDGLFDDIPAAAKLSRPLDVPRGLSELEMTREVSRMAARNVVYPRVFRGAGAYRHFIPAIVSSVASKEEFVTAYTPYQPEISQGVLQSIFEFQTQISELCGLPVSNASVYDGASAAGEAAAMCRERGRTKTLVSAAAHPDVIATMRTYCWGAGADLELIPECDGRTDLDALRSMLDETVAGVYIQYPNFYGVIEDAAEIAQLAHAAGAKLIMGCNPIALGLLKSPGELGADIAVGEGQPLGMPLSFGGPYLGFMACSAALTRRIPGRIAGETTDRRGKRAFVLTLQAREQHIRREKAGSNVCSNQALCALTASAYLAVMGPSGLRETARQCASKAAYLRRGLESVGYAPLHNGPHFHEFVTSCPHGAQPVVDALHARGMLAGLPLGDSAMLWCATEMNTRADIDELCGALKEVRA